MNHVALSVVALLVGVAALADDKKPGPLPEAAQKELARLQGQWVVKEGSRYGKKFDLQAENLVLEIKGVKWIFTGLEKGEFVAIDPKADPKCFDLKSVEEGRKGQVDEAIYKIEGDTLTVCLHQGKGKQRPARFETSAEQPDTILMAFGRVKNK